jgi:hypothetical protein
LTNNEFAAKFKDLGLTKKTFSEKTSLVHRSVVDWSLENKRVPTWADSWFQYYADAQKFYIINSQLNKK